MSLEKLWTVVIVGCTSTIVFIFVPIYSFPAETMICAALGTVSIFIMVPLMKFKSDEVFKQATTGCVC